MDDSNHLSLVLMNRRFRDGMGEDVYFRIGEAANQNPYRLR